MIVTLRFDFATVVVDHVNKNTHVILGPNSPQRPNLPEANEKKQDSAKTQASAPQNPKVDSVAQGAIPNLQAKEEGQKISTGNSVKNNDLVTDIVRQQFLNKKPPSPTSKL